jgi:hypothetical protein
MSKSSERSSFCGNFSPCACTKLSGTLTKTFFLSSSWRRSDQVVSKQADTSFSCSRTPFSNRSFAAELTCGAKGTLSRDAYFQRFRIRDMLVRIRLRRAHLLKNMEQFLKGPSHEMHIPVFQIRDIFVRSRIRGSVRRTYGSGSCSFRQ